MFGNIARVLGIKKGLLTQVYGRNAYLELLLIGIVRKLKVRFEL